MAFTWFTLLLLFASGLARAQVSNDATALVSEVARVARTSATWIAEGDTAIVDGDGRTQLVEHVRFSYRAVSPTRARLEVTSTANNFVRVCDGTAQWTYYPSRREYVKVLLPQIGPCAYPLNAWPPLSLSFRRPVLAGTDHIVIDGHPRECDVVRGIVEPSPSDRQPITMCVDSETKRILRFRIGGVTTTFSSIQPGAELNEDLFRFQAPEGSTQVAVINWLEPIAQTNTSAFRVSNAVPAPVLSSYVVPVLTDEAVQKSFRGAAVLYAEINEDGMPQIVRVLQTAGIALDERAIEALKQWRFAPMARSSKLIPVVTAVAVFFRSPTR